MDAATKAVVPVARKKGDRLVSELTRSDLDAVISMAVLKGLFAFSLLSGLCWLVLSALVSCGGTDDTPLGVGGNVVDGSGGQQQSDAGGSGGATASGGAASACVPGKSDACIGPGGCEGGQVCKADGSGYGECQCEASGSGGSGTGSGGSSGKLIDENGDEWGCLAFTIGDSIQQCRCGMYVDGQPSERCTTPDCAERACPVTDCCTRNGPVCNCITRSASGGECSAPTGEQVSVPSCP